MEIIPLTQIQIAPDRQRRVFKPETLGKLAESITTKGLFHAPVIRADSNTLVAGERRIKAIGLIYTMGQSFSYNGEPVPPGHIPVNRLSNLSEDDFYEAELEENIRRDNLSPQEEMQAIAKLHNFRKKQNPSHTAQETAAEVYNADAKVGGSRVTSIRDAILVSEHMDDPAVFKAKTKQEAIKAVEKKLKREHAKKLAGEFTEATAHKSPHIPVHGEAVKTMQKMPSGIVDVICSDPPYGINAQNFGDMADNSHNYDDSYDTWRHLMRDVSVEAYRVCKPKAHMYLFCDWTRFAELKEIVAEAGWSVWQKPLIWSKGNGMLPRPEYGPRYTYETILFANKGNKQVTGVFPDVLAHKTVQQPRHAAEKPVGVYIDLLSRSALPGDHVLDMFAGSGVLFPAANKLKLRATGIELDPASFGIAIQRLEEKPE